MTLENILKVIDLDTEVTIKDWQDKDICFKLLARALVSREDLHNKEILWIEPRENHIIIWVK